jgi:hypothetical protein
MTTEERSVFMGKLKELGLECKEYDNYSGRNMFGTKTDGVIVPSYTQYTCNVVADELGIYLRLDTLGKSDLILY